MSDQHALNPILTKQGFHGSYRPEDVTFLLNICELQATPVEEKERLIQSGEKHYSQMISEEFEPTAEHLKHFHNAMALGASRLAQEVQQLSHALSARFPEQPIVLVSLVRAGVPLGVLLKHCIEKKQPCFHYAISIIRDRGLDLAALNAIIQQHGASNLVFVDGWTGKGAICRQLTQSLTDYPELFDMGWDIPRLVTLSDLGGYAWLSASSDDWLIPSGILGSVISGLISRSIMGEELRSDLGHDVYDQRYWHSCVMYDHLKHADRSRTFIDHILALIQQSPNDETIQWNQDIQQTQQRKSQSTIQRLAEIYHIQNINHIKPSIAEATRAVLRRIPDRILIRDPHDPDVQLLMHFAQEREITVDVLGDQLGPYRAVTLIKKIEKKT